MMSLHVEKHNLKIQLKKLILQNVGSIVGMSIFLFGMILMFILVIAVEGTSAGVDLFKTIVTPLEVPVQVIIPLAIVILLCKTFGNKLNCCNDKTKKQAQDKNRQNNNNSANHRRQYSGNAKNEGFLESSM